MKQFLSIVLGLFLSSTLLAQDYMDKIVDETCSCTEKISASTDQSQFTLELGLCMLNASKPYSKQLKKDYKIDFDKIDTQGEELGRIIGLRMATTCPNALMHLVSKVEEEMATEELEENTIVGTITSVKGDKFVEFSVKDELGKVTKFEWITYVQSNADLMNEYESLVGKKVSILYTKEDLFDARIGEYRTFNLIIVLDVID